MTTTVTSAAELCVGPRRAEGAVIHAPAGTSDQWVLQRGDRYLRVTQDVAELTEALDGRRQVDGLAQLLGPRWTPQLVEVAVTRLDQSGFIQRADLPDIGETKTLKIVSPLTVQLTLLRPGATMERMRPFFQALASPLAVGLAIATTVLGLLSLWAQRTTVGLVLSEPLGWQAYVGTLLALLIGTTIHEIGHAAALIRHGGRPSRLGVMFFYLLPAAFCDVSDGWRLPRRRQRVEVALAGPAVQTCLGGASALAAWALPPGQLESTLLFFALSSFVTGVLNLLPLVKLDGYLALMAATDIPYLRDRAMADARGSVAKLLFGGRFERDLASPWVPFYGLACMLFPLYLLATAAALWLGLLQSFGIGGLALSLLAAGYALYLLARGLRNLARQVRSSGARPARVTVVCAAIAAAIFGVAQIPVEQEVEGAYVQDAGGTWFVAQPGTRTDRIAPGQRVVLRTNGIARQDEVAAGTVVGPGDDGLAPFDAFLPVLTGIVLDVPGTRFPLAVDPGARDHGRATVSTGSLPLWEHVHQTFIQPFFTR